MENFQVYRDIQARTGGDIYIGVVGPVRTGKATFVRRFMELVALPGMDPKDQAEVRDALPLSGSGKIITTVEPKFIPKEAVSVKLGEDQAVRVKLIDCVGFLVKDAAGHVEDGRERMVKTPWSDNAIPFHEAAGIGTGKVIREHSTIGFVVTTDGSFGELPRENFLEAEERTVAELKKQGKPFLILLNSQFPHKDETQRLAEEIRNKYGVSVVPVSCEQLRKEDITRILEQVLYEFPVNGIKIDIPRWLEGLENGHWLKSSVISTLLSLTEKASKLREINGCVSDLEDNEYIRKAYIGDISAGDGSAEIDVAMNDNLFYDVLSETIGMDIKGDYELISIMKELSQIKNEYGKISPALSDVKRKGYGIVGPAFEDISLEEPEVFRHGSRYGIRIKARGEAINMIKTDIETEVAPIVGTEEQSKEFIDDILNTYKTDRNKIWELNLFGRTLDTLVSEGMNNKIYAMPEDAQMKLQESLQKILNEGGGGLICIIL